MASRPSPAGRSALRPSKYAEGAASTLPNQGESGHTASSTTEATSDEEENNTTPLCRRGGRGVRFGSVRLHTHKRVLGDNPAVRHGPPITFDWAVESSERFQTVDDYSQELRKEDEDRTKERHPKVKRIDGYERTRMLRRVGHTYGSITRVYKDIEKIKKTRTQPTDPVIEEDDEEEEEKPKARGLGRWFGGGGGKKQIKPAAKPVAKAAVVKRAPTNKRHIGLSTAAAADEATV